MTPALDDGPGDSDQRVPATPTPGRQSRPSAAERFGVSPDLPHTDKLAPLRLRLLKVLRRPAFWLVSRWWHVEVIGADHVPAEGPVILAANHIGALDGPVVIGATDRLVLAMAKHELFTGRLGRMLNLIGQVPVNRRTIDLRGIRRSVHVLRSSLVLAVFPEGLRAAGDVAWSRGGAVYLAMITGATIVPVAILGTRMPGTTKGALPPRRQRIVVMYGEPFQVPRVDWPRRKAVVAQWNEELRVRLAAHVREAVRITGVELPGPPSRPS